VKPRPGRSALQDQHAIGAAPSQRRGAAAEERACAYLRQQGLKIAARNVRYRAGEIDVIATDGNTWVFVEVRSRSRSGEAVASIDSRKRGKIRRAAQLYLSGRFGDHWPPCRFDVVAVEGSRITWLPSAFTGEEEW
jgi:putative endonuclease